MVLNVIIVILRSRILNFIDSIKFSMQICPFSLLSGYRKSGMRGHSRIQTDRMRAENEKQRTRKKSFTVEQRAREN